MVQTRRIELKTRGHCDIIDITHRVAQEVVQTGLKDGTVTKIGRASCRERV